MNCLLMLDILRYAVAMTSLCTAGSSMSGLGFIVFSSREVGIGIFPGKHLQKPSVAKLLNRTHTYGCIVSMVHCTHHESPLPKRIPTSVQVKATSYPMLHFPFVPSTHNESHYKPNNSPGTSQQREVFLCVYKEL